MYKTLNIKDLDTKDIYRLMISGISPRPIAFVASRDSNGNHNLSPFSYFNAFGSNPPVIGFSPANSGRTGNEKDTLKNIESTKEFSVSIVDYSMVEQVSLSSCEYDSSIDEFVKSGFLKENSTLISVPYVSNSPFSMECKLHSILRLGGKPGSGNLVLGEIICFHIRKDILTNDKIDPNKLDPVSRLGFNYYSRARDGLFEVFKPKHNGIGFDELPRFIRENPNLTGSQIAKLAGVKTIPVKSNDYSQYDSLTKDELYNIIYDLLDQNNIYDAWQIAIRLIEKNGQ